MFTDVVDYLRKQLESERQSLSNQKIKLREFMDNFSAAPSEERNTIFQKHTSMIEFTTKQIEKITNEIKKEILEKNDNNKKNKLIKKLEEKLKEVGCPILLHSHILFFIFFILLSVWEQIQPFRP